MKKLSGIILGVAIILTMSVSLAACGLTSSELDKLQTAFAQVLETSDSLDEAAAEDLENNSLSNSSLNMAASGIIETESTGMTQGQKVVAALNCYNQVKTQQNEIDDNKTSIEAGYATFKQLIKDFSNKGLVLTDEENILLANYIDEVLALKESINGTIGKVYVPMKEAKGLYKLETIDEALVVLNEVCAQMDIRAASVARIYEIITEANSMLENRVNETIE